MLKEKEIREEFRRLVDGKGKLLIWSKNYPKTDYEIVTEDKWVTMIKDKYKELLEEYNEEDITLENIKSSLFDFEYKGYERYFDSYEKFKDKDYKYCYLVIYIAIAENYKEYLQKIVYTNKKINTEYEFTEILEGNNQEIPGEFGVKWANHYYKELNEFEEEKLFELLDCNNDIPEEIEIIYIDDIE
ncbi:MAG: hypothetical protein H0Z24_06750 [Thermosipho sp. (in: Bacteria)]|nr:hypothetical protein [Thermosipho sp. (in: thermotogales)]